MKKIIILISGKLKYLSDKNFLRIKNSLKNFEIDFILTPWELENEKIVKKFEDCYSPLFIKKISQTNHNEKIKLIKFPDYAGSMEGFFYNWEGICKGFKAIINFYSNKNYTPDYVLRYRSDILPKENSFFNIENNLTDSQIVIPDRYHWNGINDQIFLIKYNMIKNFDTFFEYIDSHIEQKRFFSGEYIFYKFLKKNKLSPVFNDFNYSLMRGHNFKKNTYSNNFKSRVPFRDYIEIKLNKIKYKLRNFNDFFILKNKRNKHQDIKID